MRRYKVILEDSQGYISLQEACNKVSQPGSTYHVLVYTDKPSRHMSGEIVKVVDDAIYPYRLVDPFIKEVHGLMWKFTTLDKVIEANIKLGFDVVVVDEEAWIKCLEAEVEYLKKLLRRNGLPHIPCGEQKLEPSSLESVEDTVNQPQTCHVSCTLNC